MNLTVATEMCKQFEGFRSAPYLCPAGVATIGYGSTYYEDGRKVTLSDPKVDVARAEALLTHELHCVYLPGVIRLCPGLVKHEGKLNAIVDFVYNLGVGRLQTSTLRKRIVREDWAGAGEQLLLWVYGGGKKLPGLVRRRNAEASFF